MSRGKYSPNLPNANMPMSYFKYNAKGDLPPERPAGTDYQSELYAADYDPDGYDMYGYSSYDIDGNYIGDIGAASGIDRNGITETEYLIDDSHWI